MNYVELVNNFWEKDLEFNFSDKEIALYFYLLNVSNRLTWKNPFGQSNAMMIAKFGWGKSSFDNAKKKLKDAGLIDFRAGDGRGNTYQYTICGVKVTKKGTRKSTLFNTLSDTLSDTLSRQKTEASINLNKTKTNNPLYSPEVGGDEVELNSSTEISDQPQAQERKSCAKKKEPLNTSFVEPSLQPIVADWLAYKSERGQTYRQRGFEMLYKKLVSLSNGNPAVAREIVEQSMANNWAGIFEIKQTHGNDKHREGAGTPPPKAGVYTDAL